VALPYRLATALSSHETPLNNLSFPPSDLAKLDHFLLCGGRPLRAGSAPRAPGGGRGRAAGLAHLCGGRPLRAGSAPRAPRQRCKRFAPLRKRCAPLASRRPSAHPEADCLPGPTRLAAHASHRGRGVAASAERQLPGECKRSGSWRRHDGQHPHLRARHAAMARGRPALGRQRPRGRNPLPCYNGAEQLCERSSTWTCLAAPRRRSRPWI
jgi:hypothetical protein